MQLKEAERIFFEGVTTTPMAIQPVVMEYSRAQRRQLDSDVETYTTAFVVRPAKGEYIFTSSCELRKIIIKPSRYNLVQMLYVKPSPQGTDDPEGNRIDDCFVTKWEVDQTQFDAIGVDGSEAVIFFRAKIGNFWLTGEEGRFIVTKDRIATIDLTDFDGRGYYAESGERIEWEILSLDISSIRLLKMLNFQTVILPYPITDADNCPVIESTRYAFKNTPVDDDLYNIEYNFGYERVLGWLCEGLVNTGLPTVLMVSTDAVRLWDKVGIPVIKGRPTSSNTNPVLQVMMGHPVGIIFGGLKFPKNCKIRR